RTTTPFFTRPRASIPKPPRLELYSYPRMTTRKARSARVASQEVGTCCSGGPNLERRRGACQATWTGSGSWQARIESRLAEVGVGRQRITKPEHAHDPK